MNKRDKYDEDETPISNITLKDSHERTTKIIEKVFDNDKQDIKVERLNKRSSNAIY